MMFMHQRSLFFHLQILLIQALPFSLPHSAASESSQTRQGLSSPSRYFICTTTSRRWTSCFLSFLFSTSICCLLYENNYISEMTEERRADSKSARDRGVLCLFICFVLFCFCSVSVPPLCHDIFQTLLSCPTLMF